MALHRALSPEAERGVNRQYHMKQDPKLVDSKKSRPSPEKSGMAPSAQPERNADTPATPQEIPSTTIACEDTSERPSGECRGDPLLRAIEEAKKSPELSTAWPRSCEPKVALTAAEKRRKAYLISKRSPNKRRVAFHEAAHCRVAEYYGFGWKACLFRDECVGSWTGEQRCAGRIQPSLFQRAVVAWAGSIAAFLLGWPLAEWPTVRRRAFEEVQIQEVRHFEKNHKVLFLAGLASAKSRGIPFRASCYGDLQGIRMARQKWRA